MLVEQQGVAKLYNNVGLNLTWRKVFRTCVLHCPDTGELILEP